MWCQIRAWLVRPGDFAATLAAVRRIQFWGVGCETEEIHEGGLGEYPWGEVFTELRKCTAQADRWVRNENMSIEQTIVRYAVNDTSAFLPAPRLLALLGARWSGYDFQFLDGGHWLIASSPYGGRGERTGPLFVRKDTLLGSWPLLMIGQGAEC